MLAKALGVNQLLVVVNKLDVTDPPWSQERYEAVKAAVGPFLTRTGFRPKKVRCARPLAVFRLRRSGRIGFGRPGPCVCVFLSDSRWFS